MAQQLVTGRAKKEALITKNPGSVEHLGLKEVRDMTTIKSLLDKLQEAELVPWELGQNRPLL